MKKLNVAIIGYGLRSKSLCESVFPEFFDKVHFSAICDIFPEKAKEGAEYLQKKSSEKCTAFTEFDDIIKLKPDAIIIASSWITHIDFACKAMENGIAVACEVGGAYNLEQCYKLVKTQEKTGTPFMFLENCCYGRLEQMALTMKEKGVLGKIVHCNGGYKHDLRESLTSSYEKKRYRLGEYIARNGETYPSHEFLPLARLLNINKGNRPLYLYSMASPALGISDYAKEHYPDNHPVNTLNIKHGDIITTVIKCANGETITLELDTTLPRPYSRGIEVRGTKAAIFEDTASVFIDGKDQKFDMCWNKCWGNIEKYYKKYDSVLWKKIGKDSVGTHNGTDYLEFWDFFDCLLKKKPMPIDVYDAALTMAITPLSEQSIATGMPVPIPDFTEGKWIVRTDLPE